MIEQIKIVIQELEKNYEDEISLKGITQLIYKRYKDALVILENSDDISNIKIVGGIRAYMDSYSDYNNPILKEMYKAEKIYKEL